VFAAPRGEAAAFARAARAELPESLVDERQGLLALGRISVHMHGLDAVEWGLVAGGHPEPELVGNGPGSHMLAAQLAWERMCKVASRDEALPLAERALADGSLYAVDNGLLWVVATMVQDLADVDVMPLWENALTLAHQRGSLFSVLSVSLWRGHSLLRRGDLPEAEEALRVAIDQLVMWQAPRTGAAYSEAALVRALIEQDRVAEARARIVGFAGAMPLSDGNRLLLEAEAEILIAEQRWAAALPLLERADTLVPHMRNPAWRRGPALLAAALANMGRATEALALLEQEIEKARRWGAPSILGALLRQSGELRVLAGASDGAGAEGLAELNEAEQLLAGTAARLEHAEALAALGTHLLDTPVERARALGLLLRALEIAESCSAMRLRRRVVEALASIGVEVPDQRRVGIAALTSTQRRIAVLSADGVPIRDVAESLFLTPRGVEQHLDEVRRRLGVDDVADLAEALAAASSEAGPTAPLRPERPSFTGVGPHL
jgi:DNA-binding CsgD family transcriptional regulator